MDLGKTLALYENKGRLLNRIEEMNRVARIAFYDQNEIAGQFNKDVLRRGRKSRPKTTPNQQPLDSAP